MSQSSHAETAVASEEYLESVGSTMTSDYAAAHQALSSRHNR